MNYDSDTVKRIVQARELIQQGKSARARQLLNGLDNPVAQQLLTKIEIISRTSSYHHKSTFQRSLLVGITIVCIFMLLFFTWLAIETITQRRATGVLPTLIPTLTTVPCGQNDVNTWWQEQSEALNRFIEVASSASRTMPGTQMENYLYTLNTELEIIDGEMPICISPILESAYHDIQSSAHQLLQLIIDWRNGVYTVNEVAEHYRENETTLVEAYQIAANVYLRAIGD